MSVGADDAPFSLRLAVLLRWRNRVRVMFAKALKPGLSSGISYTTVLDIVQSLLRSLALGLVAASALAETGTARLAWKG